jgi:hypothetical protein
VAKFIEQGDKMYQMQTFLLSFEKEMKRAFYMLRSKLQKHSESSLQKYSMLL